MRTFRVLFMRNSEIYAVCRAYLNNNVSAKRQSSGTVLPCRSLLFLHYISKQNIHSFSFLLIENMGIAVERCAHISVSEQHAQGFDIYALFDSSGRKSMPKTVEGCIFYSGALTYTLKAFLHDFWLSRLVMVNSYHKVSRLYVYYLHS